MYPCNLVLEHNVSAIITLSENLQIEPDAVIELITELISEGKLQGTEVALSIASGNGKEHMALISALLSIPVGVRFVALTRDGIVYL